MSVSLVLLEVAECGIFAEEYLTEHHCKVTFVLCMDQTSSESDDDYLR